MQQKKKWVLECMHDRGVSFSILYWGDCERMHHVVVEAFLLVHAVELYLIYDVKYLQAEKEAFNVECLLSLLSVGVVAMERRRSKSINLYRDYIG